jgi:hypothetical protein
MEILMKNVEKSVKKEIVPKYHVEYMNFWKNNMKIKINDKEKLIEKLISWNFTYNHTDERYGYVDPQILVNEMWQKTKVFGMWKFSILDNEKIVNKFIKSLISIIEQY